MPNRLTLLYSKIYYKEENYLKVKTMVFKYITPPYSKGWVCRYINILVYNIPIFLRFYIPNSHYILLMWLGYPLSHSSTGFISFISCLLILTWYKSFFNICTILFIRSVTLKLLFYVSSLFLLIWLYPQTKRQKKIIEK